ncbi:extracellular solute-binding protein [Butyrivibrio sp. XPD2006]|uniref:extracellular solute-binding protein n=1 Tax=Butyrivibrio sp. XPD2006 TaxID=1280668 RepID=UPI0003B6D242|nr:extracellular solute-binding protein [Butyrivibrio sp. XPD2006]
MKMKKLSALLMSGVLAASALVGCGSDAQGGAQAQTDNTTATQTAQADSNAAAPVETQDVSLKIWVPEEAVEDTDAAVKAFDDLHDEFNITYEIAVVGIDEAPQQLNTDPDTAADIFYTPSGGVADLVNKGLLLPITKDFETIASDLPESALTAVTVDGLTYAAPFSPNTYFMYYNKDLLTADDVKSLETILAKDTGAKYNFSTNITNSWYIESFFLGAGCTLFGPDGKDPSECSWNNETGLAAAEYIIDLAGNPKYLENKDGVGGAEFKEGNLAAITDGAWSAPSYRESLGDKLGAVALPTANIGGKEVQLSNFVDFKTITVKSTTAYPLAAQQLAVFLANPENSLTRYKNQGDVPVLNSLASSSDIANDEVAAALNAQASKATNQPSISKMGDYWTPAQAFGEGVVSGEITKANAQEKLDALVDSITGTLSE